jgi:hypothetical protein
MKISDAKSKGLKWHKNHQDSLTTEAKPEKSGGILKSKKLLESSSKYYVTKSN